MLRGIRVICAAGMAALSGLLLSAAFPPLEIGALAWIGLAPLLVVCWFAQPRQAFALGAIAGAVFWFSSIWWILRVTWAGMIAVCLYCALFTAAFAWAAAFVLRLPRMRGRFWSFGPLLAWPALWVGFEFLRANLFSGFSWNLLGTALCSNLFVAQHAEWGGVFLLSFIAALPSVGLALTVVRFSKGRQALRVPHLELWAPILLVAICWHAGRARFERFRSRSANLTIAAVQPNVPQFQKWDDSFAPLIYDRLTTGTGMALAKDKPDLLIWPETAVPDYLLFSRAGFDLVAGFAARGIPMLVGSLHYTVEEEKPHYYNSSFLFLPGRQGEPERYDKRHLVIFGEYVPFEKHLGFLRNITPIEESISPGRKDTVFRLPETRRFFSALICFEDVFPAIARRMVRAGARMLVNQTNDAWFDPSPASRQHLSHSVLRAIENRVPVVRAANSGVTCVIDRTGQVLASIPRGGPNVAAAASLTQRLFVPEANMPLSFYTRHGDWVAWACAIVSAFLLATAWLMKRKLPQPEAPRAQDFQQKTQDGKGEQSPQK